MFLKKKKKKKNRKEKNRKMLLILISTPCLPFYFFCFIFFCLFFSLSKLIVKIDGYFFHFTSSVLYKHDLERDFHTREMIFYYIYILLIAKNRYASLFFVACVDNDDNELMTLEIIHHFVEILDRYFGNVCELDLIFNFHKVTRNLFSL